MRNCPVCRSGVRSSVWSMSYKVPDNWPVPEKIDWYTCDDCGMLYGDGDFDQEMLDAYYASFYGYGLGSADNIARLEEVADEIASIYHKDSLIVDFGGGGEDGKASVVVDRLFSLGFTNAVSVGVTDEMPNNCDVILASHVLEHIYTLPDTMEMLCDHLKSSGTLIVDGPDADNVNMNWPILDFSSKHVNHFTLKHYLDLGYRYGFEMVKFKEYTMNMWHCYRLYFKWSSIADVSRAHVEAKTDALVEKLKTVTIPVNVWGLSDVTWNLLSRVDLDVLDYIDNDWAYRGEKYNGKLVLERPSNDKPILIMSQGQRELLIHNIRAAGVENELILL